MLGQGCYRIQIDVRHGTLLDGPVRLRYQLAGAVGVEPKLVAINRLLALRRLGRFPRSLYPADRRAQHWTMALCALDGARAGANHRQIAAALWGDNAVNRDWRSGSDYLRARVRRLVDIGESLASGGYRNLLTG